MSEPIVSDWTAIHDRMLQIRAEEAGLPYAVCKDAGWMPEFFGSRRYRFCE